MGIVIPLKRRHAGFECYGNARFLVIKHLNFMIKRWDSGSGKRMNAELEICRKRAKNVQEKRIHR